MILNTFSIRHHSKHIISNYDLLMLNIYACFFLSFSLRRLMTKNQIVNSKCQKTFFVLVSSLFDFKWQQNNLIWHLAFSIWFLVTDLSNENKICLNTKLFRNSRNSLIALSNLYFWGLVIHVIYNDLDKCLGGPPGAALVQGLNQQLIMVNVLSV